MLKTLKIVLNVLGGHLYNVQVSVVSIDLVHRRIYIHLFCTPCTCRSTKLLPGAANISSLYQKNINNIFFRINTKRYMYL